MLPTQSSNQSPNLEPGTEFFASETGRRNGNCSRISRLATTPFETCNCHAATVNTIIRAPGGLCSTLNSHSHDQMFLHRLFFRGITRTTPATHKVIRANVHRSPMYSGQIKSTGPRYFPSIEVKQYPWYCSRPGGITQTNPEQQLLCIPLSHLSNSRKHTDLPQVLAQSMPATTAIHVGSPPQAARASLFELLHCSSQSVARADSIKTRQNISTAHIAFII
jgi:hypothetical protein